MIAATANFLAALSTFRSGKILYLITIAGYSKVFTNYVSGVAGQVPWIVSMDDSSTSINDMDGGADQIAFAFTVQDRNGAITADFPGFTFEGKQITLQMGLPGLAQADFVTLFTGFVDTVASVNSNTEYYFTCNDISSILAAVVYLLGDSGLPISSTNIKTLLAHPLDLLISVLGQAGLNLIPDFDGNVGGQWSMASAGAMTYSATGGQRSGGSWIYVGTGAASGTLFPKSATFTVVHGQTYTLAAYIDATHVTAGGPAFVGIYDPTVVTNYISANQVNGQAGFVSINWTVPAGVTQVKVIFDTNNATVTNATNLVFSDPILALSAIGNNLLIDVNKIRAYRDGIFSGMQFQFHLSQSVAAADFVKQQILKPLGGYLWANSLGAITVNFFSPLSAPTSVATLGPNYWVSIPEAEQLDIINQVQFQFDKDDATSDASGNYLATDTEIYGPSQNKYGTQFGEQVVQADGIRSGFQGFFTARMVSRMIFGRYGLKNLKFDQSAPDSIWQTCLLEPGDIVAVTHPQIPDRVAGVVGVTNKLFEIMNRSFLFSTGRMNLTMIDASYLSVFGLFKISPNGQADYLAGSNVFMYLCDDTDKYTNGDAGHVLG
jgi:hypothetical protein